MEKIKFEEFLNICKEFVESNSKNMDDFLELEKRLMVRTYLPMDEKAICLTKVILDSDKDINIPAQFFVMAFEISLLFDCVLAYTNVDYMGIASDQKTYENYDIIYQSGMADYILKFCQKDLDRVIRMADRSLSYENLLMLIQTFESFDSDSVKELIDEYRKFRKETDPQMVHDIAKILSANDEVVGKIVEQFNNEALEEVFSENN